MDIVGWAIEVDDLIRIALALLLGGIVGLEREYHGRPAGLRTNILVCLGATLLIITSRSLPEVIQSYGFKGNYVIDPGRLAAGIITGIGFLGAGVILKTTDFIRGVTTAACVWFSAALGIIIGMGFYFLSVISAVVAILVLVLLDFLSGSIYPISYRKVELLTKLEHPDEFTQKCILILKENNVSIQDIDYDRDNNKGEMTLTFFIRSRHKEIGSSLTHTFGNLPGVIQTKVH
jgi:putative Mg2+ transporter-C (MgtC) family protein